MKNPVRRRAMRARAADAHEGLAAHRLVNDPRFEPRLEWLRQQRIAWADFVDAQRRGDAAAVLRAIDRYLELEAEAPPEARG